MAKLRKMLGKLTDPEIVELMALIETQSRETLVNWSASYVKQHYLSVFAQHKPEDKRLETALSQLSAYMEGTIPAKTLRASLGDARKAAQQCGDDPVAQAAARAVSTACAVVFTPTNALGFTFYGAAAYAYHSEGLGESNEVYDALARQELICLLDALKSVAVANEPNPVSIDWGC